jgi:hypothetical protein
MGRAGGCGRRWALLAAGCWYLAFEHSLKGGLGRMRNQVWRAVVRF